jgi:hypothetical protein
LSASSISRMRKHASQQTKDEARRIAARAMSDFGRRGCDPAAW